jgi:adenylylsulfate kinase-like enzyme
MTTNELSGCLIVTGMPGAGKSTVTQLVAELLPRSVRLDGDELRAMIVNGGVWALGEPADEAKRQTILCNRNLCTLAANYTDANFTTVIDHVVPDRQQWDFIASLLAPRPVMFVVLAPGLQVCQQRNAARDPRQRVDYDYSPLEIEMRRELADLGWWFDTSALTPDQTADQILREASRRAKVN